jgi:ArsR family transcriptional regulator
MKKFILASVGFWPLLVSAGACAEQGGKIAVATEGETPAAKVSSQAGFSPFFLLFDPQGAILEAVKKPVQTGGERCVCELQAALQEPQPNVSRHLTILRRAGLVQAWRSRNRVMYSLADPRIADLLSQVDTLVDAETAERYLGGLEGKSRTMPTGDAPPEGRARPWGAQS